VTRFVSALAILIACCSFAVNAWAQGPRRTASPLQEKPALPKDEGEKRILSTLEAMRAGERDADEEVARSHE
jgi:hypothetical protein